MTLPVIPDGLAPSVPSYQSEIQRRDRLVAEHSRSGQVSNEIPAGSVCRVSLGVNVSTPAGTDLYALGNWGVDKDDDGLFTPYSVSGTYSYITIKYSGRYDLQHRVCFTQTGASNSCVAFITVNGATAANSVARDQSNASSFGNDGTICDAYHNGYWLNAGDVLYWGIWTYYASLMMSVNINVKSYMSVVQKGIR